MKLNRILLTLVLSMFVSTAILASSEDIKITIDGFRLETDIAPKAINGRTLVPMRAIFEAMGANVEWENSTRTATGTKGSDKIILKIGNTKASINGKEIILDSPAVIVNGSTFVPVRFIAESFGSDVAWDNKTKTVIINNKDNDKPDNESTTHTDEKYFKFDKSKGEITAYSENGPKDVVIPKTIDGIAVKSIGHFSFYEFQLTSVVIQEGVKNIGDFAFAYNKLTTVTIPSGVTSMGEGSFIDNKLTSVIISPGVKSIGYHAFGDNQIKSLTLPEGVIVECGAFADNELSSLTISEGTTVIINNAFINNKLTSLTIPNSVKIIDYYAFADNELTSVIIPDGIKEILIGAFENNKLTSVTVPVGAIIEDGAFDEGVKIIRK